jgi:type II secretory pathway component PulJ
MRAGRGSSREGLTIVELLVAGVVLVVVLGAAGVFFALQVQLQRDVQARNEVQDRVRVALQLVTQDLALVGNTIRMSAAGSIESGTGFAGCYPQASGGEACLELEDVSATSSALRLRYVSSQFQLAESCRDVAYRVAGAVLQRSDVACGGTSAWIDLAPSVLGFKTIVVCSSNARFASYPDAGCGGGTTYARSALISVAAESLGSVRSSAVVGAMTLVTEDPGAPEPVTCPSGRICFDGTQEVLMPNLKDQ